MRIRIKCRKIITDIYEFSSNVKEPIGEVAIYLYSADKVFYETIHYGENKIRYGGVTREKMDELVGKKFWRRKDND